VRSSSGREPSPSCPWRFRVRPYSVACWSTSSARWRDILPQNTDYPWQPLSAARIDALNAIGALKAYAPSPAWQIGELYALVAASEIDFGENLCSGVPLATVINGSPIDGRVLTRNALLAQALSDLDSATAYATGSDSIANLALVLKARALADSGGLAAAASTANGVPVSASYQLMFSSTLANQMNQIWGVIAQSNEITVSDREGENGLPFVSAGDPRLPTMPISSSFGTLTVPSADDSAAAPFTLTSGIEAQLLVAEAALAGGQVATWANVLNALRANAITPAMPPLSGDSTLTAAPAERLAVMFRERAFWLFGTGHRHGDLRRLVRQYGLPVESVFPTGPYQGGPLLYGTGVVYVPTGEAPNSTYHGCQDDGA